MNYNIKDGTLATLNQKPSSNQQVIRKTPITLTDLIYYNFFKKFGLSFDQKSLQQYHDAINDPQVLNVIHEDVKKLANVIDPVIQVTTDKIVTAWSKAVKQIQANGLKTVVGAIPVVGQVIDEVDNVNRTINSGLAGVNAVTGIVSNEVQKVEKTFNDLNPINQATAGIQSAQNAVAKRQNDIINQNFLNLPDYNKNAAARVSAARVRAGGGAILSRIQKSVKDFTTINKNKTAKNVNFNNMKGGLKQKQKSLKNLIIQKSLNQKGGKILSRIQQSIKEFTNSKR
jgi:hypothetical protein